MSVIVGTLSARRQGLGRLLNRLWALFSHVPLLGWLFAALLAVVLEQLVGTGLARLLDVSKAPSSLFGLDIVLEKAELIPGALIYVFLIYILPIAVVTRLTASRANWLAARLLRSSMWPSVIVHLVLLYVVLHIWCLGLQPDVYENSYRVIVARFTMIAIIATLSLNVVNGYMGEFSCSHPGFMALGAYGASIFTVILFVNENRFGDALLPASLGQFMFPIGLLLGGVVAAIGALAVAIPSFRTRGDYLAIISLAFTFIVKSFLENLEVVGGPRGLGNQPNWATLPVVFLWTVACVWIINNFVRSTLGKALNAVRDGEMAADAMTVDTRRTKMVAFLFAAFWAGVAGGLLAHVLRYVNPSIFGIQKLAEVLAMVYLGGLNSVGGSIFGAVSFNLLSESLRPLNIYKWIIIPLILILLMIFRPTGLIAFREFEVKQLLQPKNKPEKEVKHAVASR